MGRSVEEENSVFKATLSGQEFQVFLDGRVLGLLWRNLHASRSLFRGHRPRGNITRHVITLPILQPKRSRGNVGVAKDPKAVEGDLTVVGIMPKPSGGDFFDRTLLTARIVVSQDDKNLRIIRSHRGPEVFEPCRKVFR
jgi:hypothetical protein